MLLLFLSSCHCWFSESKAGCAEAAGVRFPLSFHWCVFYLQKLRFKLQFVKTAVYDLSKNKNCSLTGSIQWSWWPLAESWRTRHSQWYTWRTAAQRSLAVTRKRHFLFSQLLNKTGTIYTIMTHNGMVEKKGVRWEHESPSRMEFN